MIERFGTADLLPFNHAEMDFECPTPIQQTIKERAMHCIYGYTLVPQEYYESVIHWYKSRHSISFKPSDILYSTGVIFSLRNVVQFFTRPGDAVVLFTPIYKPLADAVMDNKRRLITVPLKCENHYYTMDFEALEREIQKNSVKMCIICNPHNPVGRVWTKSELKQLGEICLKHGVLMVADEIHCDLTSEGHPYTSISNVTTEISQRAIMISSFTKTFNTSGLKIANVFITNPELRKDFYQYFEKKFIYAPNVFGILALISAYRECAEWVDLLTHYLDENYRFACDYIESQELPIKVMPREGTPLLWLDFRQFPLAQKQIFQFLLEKAKIISYDGIDFTANGAGFQRLSLGYPRKILEEGLKRISAAYASLINP